MFVNVPIKLILPVVKSPVNVIVPPLMCVLVIFETVIAEAFICPVEIDVFANTVPDVILEIFIEVADTFVITTFVDVMFVDANIPVEMFVEIKVDVAAAVPTILDVLTFDNKILEVLKFPVFNTPVLIVVETNVPVVIPVVNCNAAAEILETFIFETVI